MARNGVFERTRNKTPISVGAEQFPQPFLHLSDPLGASSGLAPPAPGPPCLRSSPGVGGSHHPVNTEKELGFSCSLIFVLLRSKKSGQEVPFFQQSLIVPAGKRFGAGKIPSLPPRHLPTAGAPQNKPEYWEISIGKGLVLRPLSLKII